MNPSAEKHISHLWCSSAHSGIEKWEHIEDGLFFLYNCMPERTVEQLDEKTEVFFLGCIAGERRKQEVSHD